MANNYHYEQGGIATFYINFVHTNGMPATPDPGLDVMFRIETPTATPILTPQKMTQIREGYFIYDWTIPAEQTIGTYKTFATTTIDGIVRTVSDTLEIVNPQTEEHQTGGEIPYVMNGRMADLIGGLFYMIREAQEIPVRDELAIHLTEDSNKYKVTFGKWNQSALPEIRRNKLIVPTSSYSLDYNGYITFNIPVTNHDSITVTYNFSWFDLSELAEYIRLATQAINYQAPGTNFSPENAPANWDPVIIWGAAAYAMRRLLFGLAWQQPQLVYSMSGLTMDGVTNAKDIFNGLLTSYSELFTSQSNLVKRARWPKIAQISVPEYTMPGGRCLSSDTSIYAMIEEEKIKLTVEKLFEIVQEKNPVIKLLAMQDEKLVYSPMSKIWKSGVKKTYILKSGDKSIRVSKEHLIYIPNEEDYKPLKEIEATDNIMTYENEKLVEKNLDEKPIPHKKEETYDIEMPETQNFIGNDIVIHNSRWFRYLYK